MPSGKQAKNNYNCNGKPFHAPVFICLVSCVSYLESKTTTYWYDLPPGRSLLPATTGPCA